MNDIWNKRYSGNEYVYGKEPNQFLKEELSKLIPGKILFLGEGEGRNSVYAATLGWETDAIDYSESGKIKALKFPEEKRVNINYSVEDLFKFTPNQNYYDAVVIIYLHLDDDLRESVNKKALDALKTGGKIIFEAFEKDQINNSSGGPKNAELLYLLSDIVEDFIEMEFEKLSKDNVVLSEGEVHKGKAAVIRFVGKK